MQKGGILVNRSFCKSGTEQVPRPSLDPRQYSKSSRIMSPAFELLLSSDEPFQLKPENINKFLEFKRENNKWFKFVIFEFNKINYLYVMFGNPENNKHPLCIIYGIKEIAPEILTPGFNSSFDKIMILKDKLNNDVISIDVIDENNEIITEFNAQLFANFQCMKAISAGSGTILEDGSLCINNKSGHFRPAYADLEIASHMFAEITGMPVSIRLAADKSLVESELGRTIQGFKYDNYSGTCLKSQDK